MLYVRRNNGSDWLTNWFNDGFLDGELMRPTVATAPAVNVKEDVKAYTMEIASPGLKKEYVRVHVDEENVLHIALENKMEHKGEDKHEHYLRREFSYSNFEQAFTLPEDVDKEKISAKVADGVLTVELPKLAPKEEAKTQRQIEVF
ncbi:MAG: Hsp20 family protein [Bacteroidaceae bacterium]|nr:Hsp20 family protein [Bacteroidaceae bacterium]